MSREVRTLAEGNLRWIQASGTGAWNTASAAASALVGFVQAGTNFVSAQGVTTIMERGTAHHLKRVSVDSVPVKFTYLQAVTANIANPAQSSGVSTPQVHFELKTTDTENAAATAQYFLFLNCVLESRGWTEGANGNQFQESWRALSVVGPTGSGYLA